jgi:hypothetical protein
MDNIQQRILQTLQSLDSRLSVIEQQNSTRHLDWPNIHLPISQAHNTSRQHTNVTNRTTEQLLLETPFNYSNSVSQQTTKKTLLPTPTVGLEVTNRYLLPDPPARPIMQNHLTQASQGRLLSRPLASRRTYDAQLNNYRNTGSYNNIGTSTLQNARRIQDERSTSSRAVASTNTMVNNDNMNKDFDKITKLVYQNIQLTHHKGNWNTLPTKLDKNLTDLFSLITPPAPDQMLKEQLDTIKRETSLQITLAVREHIRRKIEENNTTLPDLDPTNKLEAINIAKQRIRHNFGRKINHTEIEELANRYSEQIGANKTNDHSTDNSTDNSTATRVLVAYDKIVRIQYPTALHLKRRSIILT